ncbi:MAG: hypothetical protein QXR97_05100 [Thermoproteota archaeon]
MAERGEVVQPVHLTDIRISIPPYPPFNKYSLGRGMEETVKTLDKARDQLWKYFAEDKWIDYVFRKARFGIPITIYLEDLNKIIGTEFREGIDYIPRDINKVWTYIVWNPNYGS